MLILENERFICKYKYDESDEEFEVESSSRKYLEDKIVGLTDCGKGVSYKIFAVINEGYEEPPSDF